MLGIADALLWLQGKLPGPGALLTSQVTRGKQLELSVPLFPCFNTGMIAIFYQAVKMT